MYRPRFRSIRLESDTLTLNPLLEPGTSAHLSVFGVTEDGKDMPISSALVRFHVQTLLTSGDSEVAEVSPDGTVIPKNGGCVRIEASYVGVGMGLTDSVRLVVRPFYREYHKTLTYKLFLAMEPYGSLRNPPDGTRDASVYFTFGETLELVRRIDRLSPGLEKIVYLVGWQRGGHDHGYPAFGEVNPRLADQGEAPADGLRRLMREGKKYHTTVSLHINLLDAYEDSPLWERYHRLHILKENPDGSVMQAGGSFAHFPEKHGVAVGTVLQSRLWETGEFDCRMRELLALLPELSAGHTIHIDNWRAEACEALGVTKEDDEDAIRKMYLHMRSLGLDVTSEGSFHGRNEPMTGLQPMTWVDIPYHPSVIPPALYCGGRHGRSDFDPRFGDSIHIEQNVRENLRRGFDPLSGIQEEICLYTMPWRFLNNFSLVSFDGETAVYTDGVSASLENGEPVIRQYDTVIRDGSTLFVPLPEQPDAPARRILVYCFRDTQLSVRMPRGWEDVSALDLYYLDRLGNCPPVPEQTDIAVSDGRLRLFLPPRFCGILLPADGNTKINEEKERKRKIGSEGEQFTAQCH